MLTLEARNRYSYGKAKGYHCYKMNHDMFGSDVYYDRTKKPEREYLTWKEFKESHGI
jgi:hypothetical protein